MSRKRRCEPASVSGGELHLIKSGGRKILWVPFMIIPFVLQVFPFQQQDTSSVEMKREAAPGLTEEEEAIIRDREILENLPLLQNLDAIDFIDILNGMDPDWSEKEDTGGPADTNEEGNK